MAAPTHRLDDSVARLTARLASVVESLPGAAALGRDVTTVVRRAGAPNGHLPPDRLDRLTRALDLTPLDVDLVVLAGLAEQHEGIAAVLRAVHPHGEAWASGGLAARLLCDGPDGPDRPALRARLAGGLAVAAGLLLVDGAGPVWDRSLRLADGIWHALDGGDALPPQLHAQPPTAHLPGLDRWLASPPVMLAVAAIRRGDPCTVLVAADSVDTAWHRGLAIMAAAGVEVLAARPMQPDVDALVSLHAVVRGAVPLVAAAEPWPWLDRHPGPAVVGAVHGGTPVGTGRPLLTVTADPLGPADRHAMWAGTMPELHASAGALAARHVVEPAMAAAVAADARAAAALAGGEPHTGDVWAGVRARTTAQLPTGVRLERPAATWDHLVLAPDRLVQLHDAVGRLRHQELVLETWGFLADRRGARGVRMLFAGPSGTGKTLSAEVLAHALDVDLLLVDLSRVVSKWIGETEKNLADVFDTAERSQAVLFFDEADALFGQRTEVRDAHDRYANLETAFLLSRLERFEGMAVLATNLRGNVDAAFTRRLEFVVEFTEPDEREREDLWRCHLPPGAPLGRSVDVRALAELYPVVGALIRNAAVGAAFLAAAEGTRIEQRHLVRCLQREYEKAARPFPGAPPMPDIEEDQWPL